MTTATISTQQVQNDMAAAVVFGDRERYEAAREQLDTITANPIIGTANSNIEWQETGTGVCDRHAPGGQPQPLGNVIIPAAWTAQPIKGEPVTIRAARIAWGYAGFAPTKPVCLPCAKNAARQYNREYARIVETDPIIRRVLSYR